MRDSVPPQFSPQASLLQTAKDVHIIHTRSTFDSSVNASHVYLRTVLHDFGSTEGVEECKGKQA